MPRRWTRILVIVAAVVIALTIVAAVLFNTGGTEPGSGDGDPVTATTGSTP